MEMVQDGCQSSSYFHLGSRIEGREKGSPFSLVRSFTPGHTTHSAVVDSNWSPGHANGKGGSETDFRQQGCLAKEEEKRVSGRQLVTSAHVGQVPRAEEPEGKMC